MIKDGTTTTSDGATIAWDRRGSGEPVVLVHGITDNRTTWGTIPDQLAETSDVIAMDVRGHGDSSLAADYSVQRLAVDVAELCADLGLDAPALVGHSLGGVLVTAAAGPAGARAVVNVDQSLDLQAMSELVGSIAGALRDPATFHATLAAVFSTLESPDLDPAIQQTLDKTVAEVDQDVVLGIWGPMLDGPDPAVGALVDEILSTVRMPYLSLHGIDPGPDYPGWLQARVPQAEIDVRDGQGHYLHLVDPDGFVDRVRAFVTL